MPPKDETLYIEEPLAAIQRNLHYTREGREEFFSQPMVQDAVALNLIVIGEAAKNLTEETRGRAPEIQWKLIAGMRDRLTHAYPSTDPPHRLAGCRGGTRTASGCSRKSSSLDLRRAGIGLIVQCHRRS